MFGWLKGKPSSAPQNAHARSNAEIVLGLPDDGFADFARDLLSPLHPSATAMVLVAYWLENHIYNFLLKNNDVVVRSTRDLIKFNGGLEEKEKRAANERGVRRCGWPLHASILMNLEHLSQEGTRYVPQLLFIWEDLLKNSVEVNRWLPNNQIWSGEEKEPFLNFGQSISERYRSLFVLDFTATLPPKFLQENSLFQEMRQRLRSQYVK